MSNMSKVKVEQKTEKRLYEIHIWTIKLRGCMSEESGRMCLLVFYVNPSSLVWRGLAESNGTILYVNFVHI